MELAATTTINMHTPVPNPHMAETVVTVDAEYDDGSGGVSYPPLHEILKELYLSSWMNKFVSYGIHTTDILLKEITDDDMKSMGMRTVQRNRLMQKINELNGVATIVPPSSQDNQGSVEQQRINSEPKRRNWKRRVSIASGTEFYENTVTGKVQETAPSAFGGEDLVEVEVDLDDEFSLADVLKSVKLSHLYNDIINDFQGDLNSITQEWMEDHCGRLHALRLKTLIAKRNNNLWYTGTTAGNKWWMNATTLIDQYYAPSSSDGGKGGNTSLNNSLLCIPLPEGYFNEKSSKKGGKANNSKNWKKAKSKMKTMAILKKGTRNK